MTTTRDHTSVTYAPSELKRTTVTIARGDGIGPEIMTATLRILDEAGAALDFEEIEVGERIYQQGHRSGISPDAWEVLRRNPAFLKAPISTPQGSGYKSLNVSIRKSLGLYANVRPCVSYDPVLAAPRPGTNVVIIRENEEDLYAGIEHRQTDEVVQCLKLISRPGCERIVRYAFEYARAHGRRRVTCMTKDNIMKLTDGLFHRVFDEVGLEYPEIRQDHMIIDIGMARVSQQPERFDVIVTLNLYGDILSDVAAEAAGGIGLAASANVGEQMSMYEAIHGSAPQIAGRDLANPSGLLLSAVQMLVDVGQGEVAENVHNAWLATLESGYRTADIASGTPGHIRVGTQAFANAVIDHLGKRPQRLPEAHYRHHPKMTLRPVTPRSPAKKTLVGIDVFVCFQGQPIDLADRLRQIQDPDFPLTIVTNRGVKVWPGGIPETLLTDHWRCRFATESDPVEPQRLIALLQRAVDGGFDLIKAENLCLFDGEPGFSLGQGQ